MHSRPLTRCSRRRWRASHAARARTTATSRSGCGRCWKPARARSAWRAPRCSASSRAPNACAASPRSTRSANRGARGRRDPGCEPAGGLPTPRSPTRALPGHRRPRRRPAGGQELAGRRAPAAGHLRAHRCTHPLRRRGGEGCCAARTRAEREHGARRSRRPPPPWPDYAQLRCCSRTAAASTRRDWRNAARSSPRPSGSPASACSPRASPGEVEQALKGISERARPPGGPAAWTLLRGRARRTARPSCRRLRGSARAATRSLSPRPSAARAARPACCGRPRGGGCLPEPQPAHGAAPRWCSRRDVEARASGSDRGCGRAAGAAPARTAAGIRARARGRRHRDHRPRATPLWRAAQAGSLCASSPKDWVDPPLRRHAGLRRGGGRRPPWAASSTMRLARTNRS